MIDLKVKSCITLTNTENITFPSMTEHQTISEPKILVVLNLFCCKILCIYLCLSISVSKSCHIVISIFFWLLASSMVLFLNCSYILTIWASLFLQYLFLLKKLYLAMLQRLPHVDVIKSIILNWPVISYTQIINAPSKSLNMNTCWSNIEISSYFIFWKLNYFSDMTFLKNIFDTRNILDDKPFMFYFLNPANHIEFFSAILKLHMDPGYILLNINLIPIGEIPTKAFPVWVFYVSRRVCVLKS